MKKKNHHPGQATAVEQLSGKTQVLAGGTVAVKLWKRCHIHWAIHGTPFM
eukprot:m.10798 g.10798  ORF g.10798 m.10798 type:complete len:50 (+) comp6093_c0_seq1:202-351(+)